MEAGDLLGAAVAGHHRRRLARVGQEGALAAAAVGWVAQGSPPRAGCSLDVLVDGAEALPRIVEELGRARSHVHLSGWFFTPGFALDRQQPPTLLRNLLADLAERIEVRVLAWAGAPLPLFHPSRGTVRRMREVLCAGTRIVCALDSRERPLHCHHEKTIVIDDEVAFVGGIDLTDDAGDRLDSPEHPARGAVGWHDAAARITGPAVEDVASHFRLRWHEVTGERLDPTRAGPAPVRAPATGTTTLQITRTVPERLYRALPRGEFGIVESYLGALRGARRLVHIETQYLWSPEIARVLAAKLREPPSPEFRLVLVLPERPYSGGEDTRGAIAELAAADAGRGGFVACCLAARRGAVADPIYVHAKIAVVDDEWLTLGSANLNDHSLFNDTEVNVVALDPGLARATRLRLWAEHLECSAEEAAGDPRRLVDERWRPISAEQLVRRQSGRPLTHRLVALQPRSPRAARLLGPLQGLVVDG